MFVILVLIWFEVKFKINSTPIKINLKKKTKQSVAQPHLISNTFFENKLNFTAKAGKHSMDWNLDLKSQQTFSIKDQVVNNFSFVNYMTSAAADVWLLSHVQLRATPRTVTHQAPLSMRFSRQEYWSGLPFLSPGDLPQPRYQTWVFCLAGRLFTIEPHGKRMASETAPEVHCYSTKAAWIIRAQVSVPVFQ